MSTREIVHVFIGHNEPIDRFLIDESGYVDAALFTRFELVLTDYSDNQITLNSDVPAEAAVFTVVSKTFEAPDHTSVTQNILVLELEPFIAEGLWKARLITYDLATPQGYVWDEFSVNARTLELVP